MARITVEDCLKLIPNRFMLVHMASKRVRQIREGADYILDNKLDNEDVVMALREIVAEKISAKSIRKKKNNIYNL